VRQSLFWLNGLRHLSVKFKTIYIIVVVLSFYHTYKPYVLLFIMCVMLMTHLSILKCEVNKFCIWSRVPLINIRERCLWSYVLLVIVRLFLLQIARRDWFIYHVLQHRLGQPAINRFL